MAKTYQDIFFDLDNTLWDFDSSSLYALKSIYDRFNLARYFGGFQDFYQSYKSLNNKLWDEYRKGKIDKDKLAIVRFLYLLEERTNEVKAQLAQQLSDAYLAEMTKQAFIEPDSFEVLRELHQKKYRLHIISDGFLEVQIIKLKVAKFSSFISQLIVSEEIGVLKPDKRLFEYALKKADTSKENSIFVGNDYENDILGAYNAGIDQVFYNRDNIDISKLSIKPTYTVNKLTELLDIF